MDPCQPRAAPSRPAARAAQDRPADKFASLVLMLHKLYALASGACAEDNADSLLHQEVLLPGHLLTIFLKERLQDWLLKLKAAVEKDLRTEGLAVDLGDAAYFRRVLDKNPPEITRWVFYFCFIIIIVRRGSRLTRFFRNYWAVLC